MGTFWGVKRRGCIGFVDRRPLRGLKRAVGASQVIVVRPLGWLKRPFCPKGRRHTKPAPALDFRKFPKVTQETPSLGTPHCGPRSFIKWLIPRTAFNIEIDFSIASRVPGSGPPGLGLRDPGPAIYGPKPYEFIGFRVTQGSKPYKFQGFAWDRFVRPRRAVDMCRPRGRWIFLGTRAARHTGC